MNAPTFNQGLLEKYTTKIEQVCVEVQTRKVSSNEAEEVIQGLIDEILAFQYGVELLTALRGRILLLSTASEIYEEILPHKLDDPMQQIRIKFLSNALSLISKKL